MSTVCKQYQDHLAGFVDHELASPQANMISQHLQNCTECAKAASAQQTMKELVRQHAPIVAAPVYLRAQIRRELDRELSFNFRGQLQQLFLRQPLPAFAAVVMLILLSGVAGYFLFQKQGGQIGGGELYVAGSIEGEIICIDCDLLDVINTPYVHDVTHRIGLRCKDGHIWSILRTEKGSELMQDPSRYRKQIRLTGQLFQNHRYIEVREFSLI
jgi:anti-sigma factor (TIGR02949 family)